jgi:hypothetical protein
VFLCHRDESSGGEQDSINTGVWCRSFEALKFGPFFCNSPYLWSFISSRGPIIVVSSCGLSRTNLIPQF